MIINYWVLLNTFTSDISFNPHKTLWWGRSVFPYLFTQVKNRGAVRPNNWVRVPQQDGPPRWRAWRRWSTWPGLTQLLRRTELGRGISRGKKWKLTDLLRHHNNPKPWPLEPTPSALKGLAKHPRRMKSPNDHLIEQSPCGNWTQTRKRNPWHC